MVKALLVLSELDEVEIEFNRDEMDLILSHKINISLYEGDYCVTDVEYSAKQKRLVLWMKEAK
ncbi:hypothetical protein ACFP56_05995 [Paenibacillus septentrionalis]|uniref:Uncharacterized protein n=1 Tax=Paenibacillus septentrionalis TaxID=429342 RepID=A0ABW1V0B3_9BACL